MAMHLRIPLLLAVLVALATASEASTQEGQADLPAVGDRVVYAWYELDADNNRTAVATLEARWLGVATSPTPDQRRVHALRLELETTDHRGANDRTITATLDFDAEDLQQIGVTQIWGTPEHPVYSSYVAPEWSVRMCGLSEGLRLDVPDGPGGGFSGPCLVPGDAPGSLVVPTVTWVPVEAQGGRLFQTSGTDRLSEMHFEPGVPYPMRLTTDMGNGTLRVVELTDLFRGDTAMVVPPEPPADQPPELRLKDADPMGPGPTEDTPWPLDQALRLLEEDEASKDWLRDHPEAWLSVAGYDQSRFVDDVLLAPGHPYQHDQEYHRWSVVLTDGKDSWPATIYLSEQCKPINDAFICPTTELYDQGVTRWEDAEEAGWGQGTGAYRPAVSPTPRAMQEAIEHFAAEAPWSAPYRFVLCGPSGCETHHGIRTNGYEEYEAGDGVFAPKNGTSKESYWSGVYWREERLHLIVRAHHVEYEEAAGQTLLGQRVPLPTLGAPRVPVPLPPLPRLPDEGREPDEVLLPAVVPGGEERRQAGDAASASTASSVVAGKHILSSGVVVVAAAATGGLAAWFLLKAPLLGLFSRVLGRRALEHPLRQRIHAAVAREPGLHIRELSRRLGVPPSTIRHHLSVLQKAGLASVRVEGGVSHCFMGNGVAADATRRAAALKSRSARAVLQMTEQRLGVTPSEIARATGLSQRTVYYHLRRLRDAGLVR